MTMMKEFPVVLLTATIWAYWIGVGVMVIRVRRQTRTLAGLVPEQSLERLMWLIWIPLIAAWIVLPYLAMTRAQAPFAVPEFAWQQPVYSVLRVAASVCATLCLLLTSQCWARMGKNWRMGVSETQKTELITDGVFAYVRHPIYALSMLLMICSVIVVPTLPMLVIAVVHIVLMNIKAHNEERYLLKVHGEQYQRYLQRTSRFFPGSLLRRR